MEKFIPYEKLPKKEQQKINKARRGTWGELNPVTRKPENSKAYNRKRAQAWKKEFPGLRSLCFFDKTSEFYTESNVSTLKILTIHAIIYATLGNITPHIYSRR